MPIFTRQQANEVVEGILFDENTKRWDSEPQEVVDFVRNAAKTFLGFENAKDEYRAKGDVEPYFDEPLSEYDDPEDEELHEYADDLREMSDRNDEFAFRLQDAIEEGRLRKVKGFKELMTLASTKSGFNGTESQFEEILKQSPLFNEVTFDIITRVDY